MPRLKLSTLFAMVVLLGGVSAAHAASKVLDRSKSVVVNPFESTAQKSPTPGLLDATRTAVTSALKDAAGFKAILTPEQAKDVEKATVLELSGTLVDFDPGNAGKRLMIGFGSGRAHAAFEFTIRDAATGEVVWQARVKQTASFWFNSYSSSAAERAELPEGVANKLLKQLKKPKN